jgi:Protein of unknown function (DUF3574)
MRAPFSPELFSRSLVCLAFVLAAFAPLLAQSLPAALAPGEEQRCGKSLAGKRYNRTELYLGMSTPDGATVTDAEFQRFVDDHVTTRFPEGFTIVAASGQFKDSRGAIVREDSRVLVVLYPLEDSRSSNSIESIRAAYRTRYQQESVLRVDDHSCASF